jgi:hypothetical protein
MRPGHSGSNLRLILVLNNSSTAGTSKRSAPTVRSDSYYFLACCLNLASRCSSLPLQAWTRSAVTLAARSTCLCAVAQANLHVCRIRWLENEEAPPFSSAEALHYAAELANEHYCVALTKGAGPDAVIDAVGMESMASETTMQRMASAVSDRPFLRRWAPL